MTKPPELLPPATASFSPVSVSISPPNAMATATVDSTSTAPPDDPPNHLHFPLIDLRLLSQTELYSLSLSTTSFSPSSQDDDVLIPKIDRSVFNESAGSRKQTFSRLRLAPRNNPNHFSRQNPNPNPIFSDPQPLQQEDSLIISLLKQLFAVNAPEHSSPSTDITNETGLVSVPVQVQFNESNVEIDNSNSAVHTVPIDVVSSGSFKRKRGRPRKNEAWQVEIFKSECERERYNDNVVSDDSNGESERKAMESVSIEGVELGLKKRKRGRPKKNEKIVEVLESERDEDDIAYVESKNESEREMVLENVKGVVVDLVWLGKMEDPFEDELRRRAEGLRSEEELLRFLAGLEGEWASWRKRRKVVDAGALGDALPRGWKVVVRLKKKGDQVCLGSSRYISPDRKQFLSCKDVSSYLVSYFSIPTSQGIFHPVHDNQHIAGKTTIENDADPTYKKNQSRSEIVGQSPLPVSSITIDHQNHSLLSESKPTEKLQGDESFRCHKCTMAFREKDSFLYHLLSSHKKSRKSKNGPQGCEQVILRDGKYECQVCHKIFEQKSGYDGHMGNHIKDYVKRVGRGPVANYSGPDYGANTPHVNSKLGTPAHPSLENLLNNLSHVKEVTAVVNNNEHSVSGYSERQETISRLFGDGLDAVTEGSNVIDTEGNVCRSGLNSLSDNQNEVTHEISGKPVVFGCPSYVEGNNKRVNSMVDLVENVQEPTEEKSRASNDYSIGVAKLNTTVISMDEASGNNINPSEDEASGNMQETETRTCVIPSCNDGTSYPKVNENGCLMSAKDQLLHNSTILVDRMKVLGRIGSDGNINEMKKIIIESLEKGDGQSFPSTSEQTFLADNGDAGNSKLDETENGRSTKGLSQAERVHDDKDNKVACNQKQELKHEEINNSFSGKRSDAFESVYFGCDGEIMVKSAQDSTAKACLKIFPGCITRTAEQATFGVVVENENKDSLLSPCHNKHSDGIEYKLDFMHVSTLQDGQGGTSAEIPTKDGAMAGFSGGLKHHQDSVAEFTWRTGEIVLQNDLDDIPSSVLPPSDSFHGMGAVSSKDDNEYYGTMGKLNIHSLFDDVKFGAEEHSEYNFMPTSTSQPAPPEVSTCNQEVEQGFHSSNWFEKGALPLLPKADGVRQITATCVWCGNEFNQQVDFQIEAGSVGYMCSSCKAKFSGHINFL